MNSPIKSPEKWPRNGAPLLLIALAIPVTLLGFSPRCFACASCGCTLASDWESSSQVGLAMDLRYDFVDQNQLRSGLSTISPAAASTRMTGAEGGDSTHQEVERYTRNNYVTLGITSTWDEDWKLNLQLPVIARAHSTLGTASDGQSPGPGGGSYDSNFSELGDVKILIRYQGVFPQHSLGLLTGVKVPTGRFNLNGDSTDPANPGPVPIDRGLQPGTGTTDLIFGVYKTDAMNRDWDYYVQGFYQFALASREQYRPGDGVNLNIGFRYLGWSIATPQIQLNNRFVRPDSGANADRLSTGGTLAYLSPGVSIAIDDDTAIYSFVQLPVYQYVQGVQLVPTSTFSLGLRYAL